MIYVSHPQIYDQIKAINKYFKSYINYSSH